MYVVGFSTGGVKVGLTVDPYRRLGEYARDARRLGVEVTAVHLSEPHTNYAENETALIERRRRLAGPVRKAYFPNLGFEDAVALLSDLNYQSPAGHQ